MEYIGSRFLILGLLVAGTTAFKSFLQDKEPEHRPDLPFASRTRTKQLRSESYIAILNNTIDLQHKTIDSLLEKLNLKREGSIKKGVITWKINKLYFRGDELRASGYDPISNKYFDIRYEDLE